MALDNYTTIRIDKDVRDKLLSLKYKYKYKSLNDLLKFVVENFDNFIQGNTTKRVSEVEAKARELIVKACIDLGEEAKFYPMFIIKRYKITNIELVEYFKSLNNNEIACSQVLSPNS